MRVTDEQRRAAFARRLRVTRDDAVEAVAERLVGLHSSDPATVYLSLLARLRGFRVDHLDSALYERKSLVRILGMRRTMFVVPESLSPAVHHSSTAALIASEQRRAWRLIESSGIAADGRAWVERVSDQVFTALAAHGPATALTLRELVPELREKITIRKKDGSVMGTTGVSTRILFLLATEGRIIRGRPRGTWLSSQYEWATYEGWTGRPIEPLDANSARHMILRVWLAGFGPGTETDVKWWTGWPVSQVRSALEAVDARPVETSDGIAYVLADWEPPDDPPEPSVSLLPSLDPSIMGWKERGWYLGDYAPRLFDRNGNAGPTIVAGGRVVGGWGQRPDGEVVYELFEDVGAEMDSAIDRIAAEIQDWLGDTVVIPRFRTPLEKVLSEAG